MRLAYGMRPQALSSMCYKTKRLFYSFSPFIFVVNILLLVVELYGCFTPMSGLYPPDG